MLAPVTVLVGFGVVTNVADVVPHHDMGPTCRAAVNLVAGGGEGRTVEGCLAGEEKAHKELEKDRPKIPSTSEASAFLPWLRAACRVTWNS